MLITFLNISERQNHFTLVIVHFLDCNIDYVSKLLPQDVNDLLLVNFLQVITSTSVLD